MARKRTSKNYTITPFRVDSDQSEIDLLIINFRADNLASAQAQAMIYARNDAFMKDVDGCFRVTTSRFGLGAKGKKPG
jgi:hypothetical protein